MLPQHPIASRANVWLHGPKLAPPLQPAIAAEDPNWIADVNNPVRRMGLNVSLLFIFIQFTKLHELIAIVLHVNVFLLYLVGIPAYALLFMSGGLPRTWKWPQARCWIGVAIWMVLSTPTSLWIMDSLTTVNNYFRTELAVLFVIAGFVMTWDEFRRLMKVLAWAAVVDLLEGRLIAGGDLNGRLDLSAGTMADPNDYAALLLLVMPFLLLVLLKPSTRNPLMRGITLIGVLYGLYTILSTGSRGGMLSLGVGVLYGFWRLALAQKIMGLVAIPVLGVVLMFSLPEATRMRLATTFSGNRSEVHTIDEAMAVDSANARQELLKRSIRATFDHPIFGVGIGQFQNYEGMTSRKMGMQGSWHETHNTYTQISSEAGIPAFLFLTAGVVFTFRLMNRTYRKARKMPPTPQNVEIVQTCFCVMLAMVSFSVCIFFLSMAYRFYLPALTGIAIALTRAAEHLWRQSPNSQPAPASVSWAAPGFASLGKS